MSCTDLLFASLGSMIGAGVFVLIGKIASFSRYFSWISIIISALVVHFFSKSYIRINKKYKTNDAEYRSIKEHFGDRIATSFKWVNLFSLCCISFVVALSFGGYLHAFLPMLGGGHHLGTWLCILLGTVVNIAGIKYTVLLNNITTIVGILGILTLVALGSKHTIQNYSFSDATGAIKNEISDILTNPHKLVGILIGAFIIFFAYFGFEVVIKMQKESKDPEKDIPVALDCSILITTLLYIFVSVVSLTVLSPSKLSLSESPLTDVIRRLTGNTHIHKFISVSALSLTFNTFLMMIISASRLYVDIEDDKPQVNPITGTPVKVILSIAGVIGLMVLSGMSLLQGTLLGNMGILFSMILVQRSA